MQKTGSICRAELPVAGLGNRLFPWARCVIFSHLHNVPKVDSFFPQLSIGPLLRGEFSNRFYVNLFKFRQGGISIARSPFLKALRQETGEPDRVEDFPESARGKMIVFKDFRDYFGQLNNHQALITNELKRISRRRWINRAEALSSAPVCIHVRLGDFKVAKDASEFQTNGGLRTPLSWFRDTLLQVRATTGQSMDAIVMSNGHPKALEELLSLPNVHYFDEQNPLVSLFVMAKSRLILGSGGSTFSAWGSYLGSVPTLVIPGQSLAWYKLNIPGVANTVYDPQKFDETFLGNVLKPAA